MKQAILVLCLTLSVQCFAVDVAPKINAGYIYSEWRPTDISGAEYTTQGLNIAYVEVDIPILSFRYEVTPENSADQKRIIEDEEKTPAWEKIISTLQLGPIDIDYQRMSFLTNVTLLEEKSYFSFDDGSETILPAGSELTSMTTFEEIAFLVVNQRSNDELKSWWGFYAKQYQKPYSITVNDQQLSHWIFDAKFTSYGIRMGYEATAPEKGFYPIFKLDLYGGAGEIEMVNEETLSQFLPPESQILYFEGSIKLGFGVIDENLGFQIAADYRRIEYSLDDTSTPDNEEIILNTDDILRAEVAVVFSF